MKKRTLLLALTMVSIFVLTACGGAANSNKANNKADNDKNAAANAGEEKADGKKLKIGFVTDEGGINDQSFNQGVWEGLKKAHADFGY